MMQRLISKLKSRKALQRYFRDEKICLISVFLIVWTDVIT